VREIGLSMDGTTGGQETGTKQADGFKDFGT
jgi:hypothetical protein